MDCSMPAGVPALAMFLVCHLLPGPCAATESGEDIEECATTAFRQRCGRTEVGVSTLVLDVVEWAQHAFGDCELGDARRTRRAVTLAAQVAAHPDGSTPTQTETWADCKAAYRLFDADDVSFQALAEPHWRATRARQGGTWLLIGDTTEIDFGIHRDVSDLAPTGNGFGHGFHLHSSLMIAANSDEIVGLAGAELFHRTPAPKRETLRQKQRRTRESEVWGRVIDLVGPPPEDARFIHVFDAGADNFEVFCHLEQQRCGWVVRVAQQQRWVQTADGRQMRLLDLAQSQPLAGTYELSLRARGQQPARTALIEVRYAPLQMPLPKQASAFMKACGISAIPMWVVEAREVGAPAVAEPLHWVLLTSEAVDDFDAAWVIIGWYEKRPVVEDYHKCLKTGCRVQDRQYQTSSRLERVTGMLSIVAVRLLQLRSIARTDPDRPAARVVPAAWLQMLRALRQRGTGIHTVSEFFRSLAMLGGFLGRKHDGAPGWLTIWRGLDKLLLCLRGANATQRKYG
jgi:hypothetical protein